MKTPCSPTVLGYALAVAGFVALLLAPPWPAGASTTPAPTSLFFQEISR